MVRLYLNPFNAILFWFAAWQIEPALADPPAFDPGLFGRTTSQPNIDCTLWMKRLKPDLALPMRHSQPDSWTQFNEAAVSRALAAATQLPVAPFDCRLQIYLWLDSTTSNDPQWKLNPNPYPTHAFQTLLGDSTQLELLEFERRTDPLPQGIPWAIMHQRTHTPLASGTCTHQVSTTTSVDTLLNISACLEEMKKTSSPFEAGKISMELSESIATLSKGSDNARVAAGKFEALLAQETLARLEQPGGFEGADSSTLLDGLCEQARKFAPASARKIEGSRPSEVAFWNEFGPWLLKQFPMAGSQETMNRDERRRFEKFIESCPKYRGLLSEAILTAHLSARERSQALGRCMRFCTFTRNWRSWSETNKEPPNGAYRDTLAALRGTFAIRAETQCPGAGIPSHPIPGEFCTLPAVRVASAAESFIESDDASRILELAGAPEAEDSTRTLLQQQGDNPNTSVMVESLYSKPYLLQIFKQLETASNQSPNASDQAERFRAAVEHLTVQISDDLDHQGSFQNLQGVGSLMNLFALTTNTSILTQDSRVVARNPAWLSCMRKMAGDGDHAIGLPYNLPRMGQCAPSDKNPMTYDERRSFVRAIPFYQTLYHAARAEGNPAEISLSRKRLIDSLEKYQGRLFDLVAHINEEGQDGIAHSPHDKLASYYFYPVLPTVVQSIQELQEGGQLTEREQERLEQLKRDITMTLMALMDDEKGFPPGGWAPEYTRPFDNLFAGIALSGLLECGPSTR